MMERIRVLASRFAALFRSEKLDRELKEELEFHLDMLTEENIQRGMSPEEARRSARISLGGIDQVREECAERRGISWISDSIRDIRFGARLLVRNPVFAVAAIATLGLGIGANTAIFSIINAAMPRPLPFERPEELVKVAKNWPEFNTEMSFFHRGIYFQELRQHSEAAIDVARYHIKQANLSGSEGAERIIIGSVSDNYFSMLRMRAFAGRLFQAGDGQPEAEPVTVISYGLWQRRFGGDNAVLGRTLTLDGIIYSIAGILPADYSLPGEASADLWIPMPIRESGFDLMGGFIIIGRIKPDHNIQTAQIVLDRAYQETIKARVRKSDDYLVAVKWENELAQETRSSLFLFLGVVGAVLLIACANIANLLFARTIAREDELRLRAALGAGRIRIFRQLMTESMLLALLGGGLGFLLTLWTKGFLITIVSENLVSIPSLPVDLRVFGFTLLVSAVTAVIAGVVPALRAAFFAPSLSINEGRRATTSKGLRAIFRLFVTLQIALVLTLLISSGLLLKTLLLLRQIDPGFRPENILTIAVDPSASKYPDDRARMAYFEQVMERLQTIPGIESAGITTYLPFGSSSMTVGGGDMAVEGSEEVIPISEHLNFARVSEDYFRTMNIPLLEGRLFSRFDGENAPCAVIIDSSFTRRYFKGKSPLGLRITGFGKEPLTIIGVVGEIQNYQLGEIAKPQIYTSYLQSSSITTPIWMNIVVRGSGNKPMQLAAPIRQALQSIDPDQPAFNIKTLEDLVGDSLRRQRIRSFVVGAFAALALLLAFVGIYGVVAFSVNRRVHEIGIRMAFGATRANILIMILRETMLTCVFGVILGVGGAFAAGRILASLLYGVTATDPVTFVLATVFVIAVVLAAGFIPAYHAASADPADCLRHD